MNRNSFLQNLIDADVVNVRQKVEIAELFSFESRNRFSIQTENGSEFGYCKEPKLDWQDALMRQFLGHWRNFDLVGTDNLGQKSFRAHHPHRWFLRHLDLYSPGDRYLGGLQQRFAWFEKRFDYLDAQGNTFATMNSPIWKPWTFPVTQGARKIAVIEKKWSGLAKEMFTDADNFRVRFIQPRLTGDQKLLILISAIFVDLLYFESKASR